jgi:hypothetical protein
MTISTRSRLVLFAALALAALVLTVGASGKRGHGRGPDGKLFTARLAGSILSDPAIHTVTRGGVPWDLRRGSTSLSRKGAFELEVKGLVVAGTNNPDGVTTISASLFCAPDSDATPKFTVGPVPLSSRGNAEIEQTVTVPSRCLAPVVLVHPNGNAARYIAAMGFQT